MIDIQAPRAKLMSAIIRVAGIAGFIALLVIGMWGSIAIARNTPGVFSSLATVVTSIFIPAHPAETTAPDITTEPKTEVSPTPTDVATPTPTPKPKPVTPIAGQETTQTYPLGTTAGAVSNPNGSIDLTARIIEQGIVNKDTGAFTASSSPNRADNSYRIAVRFAIENVGTKTSPQFSFNVALPTYPSNIFSAPMQQALGPGDRIEYTIGFDSVMDADSATFTVNVDPTGSINESNESNNIVHYTVTTRK